VEISSAQIKIEDYARAGIAEYFDPFERAVEVYMLEAAKYKLLPAAAEEVASSAIARPGDRSARALRS
jgi:hypothetical protein